MQEAVVGRIQDQHARVIPGGEPGGNTAAHRPAVQYDMLLRILGLEPLIDRLGVVVEGGLVALARALAEAPVVDHEKIVALAHKVLGELTPTLQAARVPLEVKNHPLGVGYLEMYAIDLSSVLHIEINFVKRKGILILKLFGQDLRPKKEEMLKEVEKEAHPRV